MMIKFKNILQEEKVLVPRHLEDRDEEYKRIIYRKIQDYIKNGSKGNLSFYGVPIIKLPNNLIKVGGHLNLYNSKIESLNNLQTVGGVLDLRFSQIKSLGNLQEVGRSLYLENSQIQSLGNLQKVGKFLDLKNTPFKSLDNLQEVGRSLYLQNTFLSKQYSKGEIFQMFKDKGIEVKGEIYI